MVMDLQCEQSAIRERPHPRGRFLDFVNVLERAKGSLWWCETKTFPVCSGVSSRLLRPT